MHGRILAVALMALIGCTEVNEPTPNAPPQPVASAFDASNTGTIQGRVVWDGDVPVAEPMVVSTIAFNPLLFKKPVHCTLPHYPRVNSETHGVSDAVVFLRGVDPKVAKPWDHAEVSVEFQDRAMRIHQGKDVSSVGFAKLGSTIDIVNRDAEYHLLRGRGAAFFTAPLQKPNEVSKRTLAKPGIVDLTSGAGYYWLHGHLFVAEHPYFVRTDAAGNFHLDQVPAGTYELVCWMPNYTVTRRERDPETSVLVRLIWAEAKEQVQTIQVRPGQAADATYRWRADQF
ncbi:MAG TPA: carboxypeptidase-like regulatory domain-containing protein [Gemmataceae bacterium]|nr:carboxypeptidase-like regulatory domain-containing protein [Gemmataceae bacterium]